MLIFLSRRCREEARKKERKQATSFLSIPKKKMASQPRAKDYDHLVKLLLIGDSGKGERQRGVNKDRESSFTCLISPCQFNQKKIFSLSPFKASASPASCCASPTTRSPAASS